jgi:beta-galactosidase
LLKEDENGNKYLAYGGDFDDRPSDYEFCGNGIVTAHRKPTAKIIEVKHLYSNISLTLEANKLSIRNKNLFKDTSDYVFNIELKKEGRLINKWSFEKTILALTTDYIEFVNDQVLDEGEYVYTASVCLKEDTIWANKGHEVDFTQMIVKVEGEESMPSYEKPELIDGDFNIGVVGEDFTVIFGKKEAGIVSLVYNNMEHLVKSPNVTFFRAFTDNDNGNGSPFEFAQWEITSRFARCIYENSVVVEKDNSYEFSYKFITPTNPSFTYDVIYNVFFDGSINVRVSYPGVEGMPNMPLIGMEFMMKNQYCNFTYYGLGEVENYSDRLNGVKLDVYSSTAKKNLTPYLNPQECGNRCGVRFVSVYDKKNTGLNFSYVNIINIYN